MRAKANDKAKQKYNNESDDDEVLSTTSSQKEFMEQKKINCDSVYGILKAWKKRLNVRQKVK